MGIQPSAKAIINGIGLLCNFLQHKMVITAFFNCGKTNIQFLDEWGDLFVAQVFKDQFILAKNSEFIVVYIYYLFGIFHNGRGIGGQKMFALAHAYYQWAALA